VPKRQAKTKNEERKKRAFLLNKGERAKLEIKTIGKVIGV